ncbi:MAG: hypothetical protein C5B50_05185 [Verrucomicrobia bacterium]|nr:MAG: hypothetical protein C5B50_05185 [Verrucomicrobiota bacterium]
MVAAAGGISKRTEKKQNEMNTVIVNVEGKPQSEAAVITAYFRAPTDKLADLMNEIRALTPEAKTELALGAAKELGMTATSVEE